MPIKYVFTKQFFFSQKHCNDVHSQSEATDVSKGGIRCQLLDWFGTEDVVVGEGEFCIAEPTYRVGRIPLGPNAVAVIVKFVLIPNAPVWRPTKDVYSLTQAVGVKIPWQADKVILDTSLDYRSGNTSTRSKVDDF